MFLGLFSWLFLTESESCDVVKELVEVDVHFYCWNITYALHGAVIL